MDMESFKGIKLQQIFNLPKPNQHKKAAIPLAVPSPFSAALLSFIKTCHSSSQNLAKGYCLGK